MKQLRRQFNNRLGTFAFKSALRWMANKDALQAERSGQKLGRFAMRFARKQREQAFYNLELAFPEQSPEWRAATVQATFEHFGMLATDFLRTPQRTDEEVMASMTENGFHNFQKALDQGKGVLAITAHFGNWERMAQYSRAMGFPLAVVARDANDQALNQMVLDLRRSVGLEVLSRGNAARAVIERLRDQKLVAVLPDQNSSESFLPFFGKPCGTVLGPAVLHLRTGAPLITAYCHRVGPGKYQVDVGPELEHDGTPEGIMTLANQALEETIRKHPEQYLWLHDRWRSARRKGLV